MNTLNQEKLPFSLCVLASSSAASGLAMLWWLAASMPGRETMAVGAIILAAFGYQTCQSVRTLRYELRGLGASSDI